MYDCIPKKQVPQTAQKVPVAASALVTLPGQERCPHTSTWHGPIQQGVRVPCLKKTNRHVLTKLPRYETCLHVNLSETDSAFILP